MSTSTNLQFSFLTQGQAQKHVTVNEALLRLDALVQLAAVSATTTAQPGSPSDGQVYILPPGKTGAAWGAMSNYALAYYRDGVWEQITPREGFIAYIADIDTPKFFDGAAWQPLAGAGVATLAGANTFTAAQKIATTATLPLTVQVNDNSANGMTLELYANSASPAANDAIYYIGGYANNSAGTKMEWGGLWLTIVDHTAGSEDSLFRFYTRIAGAETARLAIGTGLYHPSATGGDKGANTINFGAIYDDNTLLTCGPIEFARDGAIDLEKWDALTPNRHHPAEIEDVLEPIERDIVEVVADAETGLPAQRTRRVTEMRKVGERVVREAYVEERRHEAMHRFAAMLQEGFDPRDPDNFCARMKADGAVPGLITES